jgi:putative acetyltransferase
MKIRPEARSDEEAISALITAAFVEAEHSGGNEAEIVTALRDSGSLSLSLVAVEDDRVVGHVAFSPVVIDGHDEGWFGLAPVAVLPQHQRKGIGHALIEAGLQRLRQDGAAGCVVLGDPDYYRRFGFEVDAALRLEGVPPEYFQLLPFRQRSCQGTVGFHPAFGVG